MIAVYARHVGDCFRLYVEGHASATPRGRIVCAGVSALALALLDYAEQSEQCRHVRSFREPGKIFLFCREGLEGPFDMTVAALRKIAKNYPDEILPPRIIRVDDKREYV